MVAKTKQKPRAPVDRNAPMDVSYQTKDFPLAQKATLNVLEMQPADRCMRLLNGRTEYSDQTSLKSTNVCIINKLFSV